MNEDNGGDASRGGGNSPRTFRELLNERKAFFEDLLGVKEVQDLQQGWFDDISSFPINPSFESHTRLEEYWDKTIGIFETNDPQLLHYRSEPTDRVEYIMKDLFGQSKPEGLAMLIVGCYHVGLFNREDVVETTRAFLDKTCPEKYMLITACGEEVMVEPHGHKKWENKFLELVTDEKYSDRVFPIKLPERPEFHFSGCFWRTRSISKKAKAEYQCHIAFEANHHEGELVRERVKSNSPDNWLLAFRSFIRYLWEPRHSSKCVIERNLNSYKKYRPEFFYIYRTLPPYLKKYGDIDYKAVLQSKDVYS